MSRSCPAVCAILLLWSTVLIAGCGHKESAPPAASQNSQSSAIAAPRNYAEARVQAQQRAIAMGEQYRKLHPNSH